MTPTVERAARAEEVRGGGGGGGGTPGAGGGRAAELQRAASELQLRQEEGTRTPDAASLQDEPLMDDTPGTLQRQIASRPSKYDPYSNHLRLGNCL